MNIGIFTEYRGHIGTIEFDAENNTHFGHLLLIQEDIHYTGKTIKDLYAAYLKAVDRYINGFNENHKEHKYSFETAKQLIFDCIVELMYHSENMDNDQIAAKLYGILNELDKMKVVEK